MNFFDILLIIVALLFIVLITAVIYFVKKEKSKKDMKKNINNSKTHYLKNVVVINKSQSATSEIDYSFSKIKSKNYVSIQLEDGKRISMIAKDDVYSCAVPGERVNIKYKEYKGSYYLVSIEGIA